MNIKILIIVFSFCLIVSSCRQNNNDNETTRYEERALSSPSKKADAIQFYNDGYRAFHENAFNKAIELYKKAIAIDSNYIDAYDNCGLSYRRINNLDSAKVYYKKSIRLNPKSMVGHANLAIVYTDQGDLEAALNEYLEIKKHNPNDPEAYYGAADIYFRMQNVDMALENSLKALKLYEVGDGQYVGDAEYYVGLAYYRKNDKSKAIAFMQQAIKHGTKVPEKYINELNMK